MSLQAWILSLSVGMYSGLSTLADPRAIATYMLRSLLQNATRHDLTHKIENCRSAKAEVSLLLPLMAVKRLPVSRLLRACRHIHFEKKGHTTFARTSLNLWIRMEIIL